ncbi:helix-turn-helix transcriptional regulator [Sphingomonas sp. PP-F2F-A104-K0414]|uniref:XRE family transcriptional regulator n=1 Tax=Sphingomonas sp. PP-F2F-A104-K0414 TaxID=2135661 RepID=UPI0014045C29|nr:helix-turn-helix transcriptional regulator [Sphingomonas sp. PP-F2F-A104-K0414]
MTPANYLRLRRKASGLTLEQVAKRLMPRAGFRPMVVAFLRVLETDGCTAKHRDHIDRLTSVFPLDTDVYYQLVNDPADKMPRICSGCGCSAYDPCKNGDEVCGFVAPDACNRCLGETAEREAA